MSLYAYTENAPTATSVADADILPLTQGGTLKQVPFSTLQQAAGVAVATTATSYALTKAVNGNRTLAVSSAAPIAITLPAATGSGTRYRVMLLVAATATQHTIKASGTTSDVLIGWVHGLTTASAGVVGYGTTATSNTVTLNGTTTGGVAGCTYEFEDIATNDWRVFGVDAPTGTTATPFSHT